MHYLAKQETQKTVHWCIVRATFANFCSTVDFVYPEPCPQQPLGCIDYRQHCAQRKPPVFSLLRGRFWGFSARRATGCTDGVKFGTEEGTKCQISPHRCNDKGVGSQKLKFLFRFDQNLEYKRPAGAYPLRDFHQICWVCTPFQDALAVKIWWDFLEEL